MRILKTLIAVLIIGLIVVGAVGCRASTATTTTASKQVKVALGTISNAVTGTATLGLAKTQDLAFAMAARWTRSWSRPVMQSPKGVVSHPG